MFRNPLCSLLALPVLFLGAGACLTSVNAVPVPITIQPQTESVSKDTKIYENVTNTNFSSTLDLYGPDSGATFSSFVQFDSARLQGFTSAQILSASLNLYSYSTSRFSGTVVVSPVLSPWAETPAEATATGAPLATYNAVYGTVPTIEIGSPGPGQTISSVGEHSFDVASLVKGWTTGTANNGFYLTATNGMVPVADTDSPFAGIGPKLVVIVDDIEAPIITTAPSARTLAVGEDGQVALPNLVSEVVATDNTGIATVSQVPAAGTLLDPGQTTVNVTIRDLANLATMVPVVITVVDNLAPTFTQPATLALQADSATGVATVPDVTALITAADNVGVTTRSQTPAAGTTIPLGSSTIDLTLADASGNTTTVHIDVEVSYARPVGGTSNFLAGITSTAAPAAGTEGGVSAGTTIISFSTPAISSDRDLVVLSQLRSGSKTIPAIYTSTATGTPALLAYQGSSARLGAGVTFKSLLDPLITPFGAIAFAASLQGPGIATGNDQGVWSNVFGGGVQAVLREGQHAPGLPSGVLVQSVASYSLRDTGLLTLLTLRTGAGGVTVANDLALVLQTGLDAGTVLVREGSPLTSGGSPVRSISALNPALLSTGQGRSQGDQAAVAKVTLQSGNLVIVKLEAGTVTPLLTSGSPAFAGPYGSFWQTFGLPATDSTGHYVALSATLRIGQGAITATGNAVLAFSDDDTNFSLLAREGKEAAGIPDATFASFYEPLVNANGDIAFVGTVRGTGVTAANKMALWSGQPGSYNLLARQGTAAPGADGLPLGALWSSFDSVALPDGAQAGPVILAKLRGSGVNAANNAGVWAVDSHGVLRLLLRTDDDVNIGTDVAPVLKTVKSISLLEAEKGVFGASRSFNATGSIAVQLTFTDKSQSVIRIDIP